MASLFDQAERQYTTRLVGMRAPVSVQTPTMQPVHVRPERVADYIAERQLQWPFAMKAGDALGQLKEREATFLTQLTAALSSQEPTTARRRVR